jgi:hypothetical protein
MLAKASQILRATDPKPLIGRTVDAYENATSIERQIMAFNEKKYSNEMKLQEINKQKKVTLFLMQQNPK